MANLRSQNKWPVAYPKRVEMEAGYFGLRVKGGWLIVLRIDGQLVD